MNISFYKILSLLLLALLLSAQPPSSFGASGKTGKKDMVQAFLLKQESVFIGPHQLLLTPDALRSTDLNSGITTVVNAEGNKVFVFNDKKKCYFQTKIDTMGMDPIMTSYMPFRFSLASCVWRKHHEMVFSGERIVVYQTVATAAQQKPHKKSNTQGVEIGLARYGEAPDIKLPDCLLQALQYLYLIPPPKALPVRLLVDTGFSKTPKIALQTTSIEKKLVPIANFAVPKGYKQVFRRKDVGDYAKRDAVLESVTDLIMERD